MQYKEFDSEFLIPIDIPQFGSQGQFTIWESTRDRTATFVFRTPDDRAFSAVLDFVEEPDPKRMRLRRELSLQRQLRFVDIAIHNNAGTNEADYWYDRIQRILHQR